MKSSFGIGYRAFEMSMRDDIAFHQPIAVLWPSVLVIRRHI